MALAAASAGGGDDIDKRLSLPSSSSPLLLLLLLLLPKMWLIMNCSTPRSLKDNEATFELNVNNWLAIVPSRCGK